MHLTEIRINLCGDGASRLRAFCSLTIDDTFVIHDVKLIDGPDGLFLAMPSRKLCDRCDRCSEKNHLRARFCNHCGCRLNESRYLRYQNGNSNGHPRIKLHADIAHPINAACRQQIHAEVVEAFHRELERSKQPGYVAPRLDTSDDCSDYFLDAPIRTTTVPNTTTTFRPTGTTAH